MMHAHSRDAASVSAAVARQPSCAARARFQAPVSVAQACRWRILQIAICRTRKSSLGEAGQRSPMYRATAALTAARVSASELMFLDASPCLRAFAEERRLPSGVLGPRDFTPLMWA